MSTSDPVLYPRPAGTAEALRQDAARSRQELAETIEALATRFDVRAIARRNAVAGAQAAAPAAGAAAAGAVVYGATHWSGLPRLPRLAIAAAASVIAYVVADRTGLMRRSAPTPVAIDDDVPPPALAPGPEGGDVVDVLIDQHHDVKQLFDQLAALEDSSARREMFAHLVEVLRRHEAAEQEIVHPAVREASGAGALVADERLSEEAAADRALASLISRGPDDRHFGRDLAALRSLVEAHAAREEAEEFPLVRALLPVEQRRRLASRVRAAQSESW